MEKTLLIIAIFVILFALFTFYHASCHVKTNSIEHSKNLSLFFVICKSCINSYIYLPIEYFYTIFTSSFTSIFIFYVRRYLYFNNISLFYYILLTYMFHICVFTSLYISSMTA